MVMIDVKSPYRLFKALTEVATEKQKHSLVSAIIASRDVRTIMLVLKKYEDGKVELSTIWLRHAARAVLEYGNTEQCMDCMSSLPVTARFQTIREPLLKKILRGSQDTWFYHPEGEVEVNWPFQYFWDQDFAQSEIDMIVARIQRMGTRDSADHFLDVIRGLDFPLTDEQRTMMQKLAGWDDDQPAQQAAS